MAQHQLIKKYYSDKLHDQSNDIVRIVEGSRNSNKFGNQLSHTFLSSYIVTGVHSFLHC